MQRNKALQYGANKMAKVRKKATKPPRTKDWKNSPSVPAPQLKSLADIMVNSDTPNLLAIKEVIDLELERRGLNE
tara:strand:+ start:884 stop:1108 length:225 start_codon:yes stop_codon:yes gene_type:complete